MDEKRGFLAVIPARGGSKRLPRKNLLECGGKPLVAWSIEAARKSRYIDTTLLSSDDKEILTVGEQYGIETLERPRSLADDTSSTFDAVAHAIAQCSKEYEYIVLLQPTSPLRTAAHIDAAIEQLHRSGADAIVSVCEMEHSPLWSNTLPDDGSMENFLDESVRHSRSQDLPTYYRLNGAIYICKTTRLLEEKSFMIRKNIVAYIMDRRSSVDIDEALDFEFATLLLQTGTTIA